MLFGPLLSEERAEYLRLHLDWPPTPEEWGTSPEALAAQEAMARQFPELDVDEG